MVLVSVRLTRLSTVHSLSLSLPCLAVGTVADKIIRPFGAMIIGSIAGAVSTVGFRFIKPVLQKSRVHDTCGVNNLHGMPGLLAGLFGMVLALWPAYSLAKDNMVGTCWEHENRSGMLQLGYQALTLGVTVIIAVLGGLITGAILRLPFLSDDRPSSYHNDHPHWETPDDFHHGSSSALLSGPVEHHV